MKKKFMHNKPCGMCGKPATVALTVIASTLGEKVRKQACAPTVHFCDEHKMMPSVHIPAGEALRLLRGESEEAMMARVIAAIKKTGRG